MPRWMVGLSFVLLVLGVHLFLHRYAWARLVRDADWPRPWRRALTIALALLALGVALAFVFGRAWPVGGDGGARLLLWTWLGFVFYEFVLLAGFDLVRGSLRLVRFVARSPRRPVEQVDVGRRVLLARSLAGAATLGAGGTVFAGRRSAEEITTPEVEVALERLPRALDGYRIVQLSDVHAGQLLGARFLERVVDVANAQRPDLIVITGDLVDAQLRVLGPELGALSKLRARHGVLFVTGNHEYYQDVEEWLPWLSARGLRVLTNERVSIGDAGASFDVAGIPDAQGGLFLPEHEPDLERALSGRDPERELVLLAHRPSQIEMAARGGVGLQLAGHTHGGQLWPFGALVGLVEPYVSGLHRHDARTQIYVSRGTGTWGPPVRVANPAEVGRIVLHRA